MSQNSTYLVRDFQDELMGSVAILEKCRQEHDFVAHLHPRDSRISLGGLDSIDRALFSLQQSWLKSMDAESASYQAANAAEVAEAACSSRLSLAQDAGLDLERVREIYERSFSEEIPHLSESTKASNSDIHRLAKFATKLLAVSGDVDSSSSISLNLAGIWLDDYKRKHSDAEEILETVSEDLERPICHFSRRLLEKAMRAPCGHCFSQDEIMSVFGSNRTTTCPSAGCSGSFAAQDLQRDGLMDIQVRLWKRAEETRRLNETRELARV